MLKDLKQRLQFTIVVLIFFPTFLEPLFSYSKLSAKLVEVNLNWSSYVGIFIFIYIVFELMGIYKTPILEKIGKLLNICLLVEVGAFIPLLFVFTVNHITNSMFIVSYKILTLISIYSIIFMPLIIVGLLCCNFIYNDFGKSIKYKKGKTGKDLFYFMQNSQPNLVDYVWLFGNLDNLKDGDQEKNDNFEMKYWAFTKNDNPPHKPKTQNQSTEYTFIIKGKVEGKVAGESIVLETGEYVIIQPKTESNLVEKVIENTVGITIKAPSIKGDTIR